MKVTNTSKKNHAVTLGTVEIKPGKSADVEGLDLNNAIVKAWIKNGIIKVEAAPAVADPAPATPLAKRVAFNDAPTTP